MKTILAEKPSVARAIAALVGATEKKDGYLTGNGYHVTWAFGHLVGLGMPEDYGLSGFSSEALPLLPRPFLLTVRKIKKDKGWTADPGALRQLKTIEKLFSESDSIIAATDAGREGELIFRYIYRYLKCEKPFERLWISSLTEKAIRQGLSSLKDGKAFDGLFHATQARSRADWLVGINATQALSLAAGDGTYSLGRVQTPTLALVCRRYLENSSFNAKSCWELELRHSKALLDFKTISNTSWDDPELAAAALKALKRSGSATVVSATTGSSTEQPPLLFDLTGLQKEANRKLGLSAEETLSIAQSLYERRFITYPRTGSRHIPEDLWPEIPGLVRRLEDRECCRTALSKMKWGRFSRRIVNDLRVTDHHGLLVTGRIPSALHAKENAVYDLIAFRLLEALSEPCTKETTAVCLKALHYEFTAKGSKVLEPGWRAIRGSFSDTAGDALQELPELKENDELKIREAAVLEKKSRPPALYSEAGLLTAMENAGKAIENDDERKALQNTGLGTPATRASIIETLLARNYILREGKSLVPTEKGLQVYGLVKDKKIADAAMTAEWELALQRIESGQADAGHFQKKMEAYAAAITKELLQRAGARDPLPELACPKCRSQQLTIRDAIVKCPDAACSWTQFRNVCGVQLGMRDIASLVKEGKTPLITGMTSRGGKKFDAYIVMQEGFKTAFAFENRKK